MRFKVILISLCFLFVIFLSNSMAQTSDDSSWNKIIHIQSGIFGNGGGYTLSTTTLSDFPYWEIEAYFKVKYKTGAVLNGGFEISKGYIGFQGNFGFTPANAEADIRIYVLGFTIEEKEEIEISTYYGEGAFLFFPMGSGVDKISPFVTVGAGGFGLSGDSEEGGYFISYGGGVRIFLEENYGINIGLKGFYMDLGSILGEPELQGEKLTLKPLQLTAGFMYRF